MSTLSSYSATSSDLLLVLGWVKSCKTGIEKNEMDHNPDVTENEPWRYILLPLWNKIILLYSSKQCCKIKLSKQLACTHPNKCLFTMQIVSFPSLPIIREAQFWFFLPARSQLSKLWNVKANRGSTTNWSHINNREEDAIRKDEIVILRLTWMRALEKPWCWQWQTSPFWYRFPTPTSLSEARTNVSFLLLSPHSYLLPFLSHLQPH